MIKALMEYSRHEICPSNLIARNVFRFGSCGYEKVDDLIPPLSIDLGVTVSSDDRNC